MITLLGAANTMWPRVRQSASLILLLLRSITFNMLSPFLTLPPFAHGRGYHCWAGSEKSNWGWRCPNALT